MNKNTITKEQLIAFIEENFDELKVGGCANYSKLYGYQSYMTLADVNAAEKAISNLICRQHRLLINLTIISMINKGLPPCIAYELS
jgi:hypothetical protein